jgi:membrane protease YdiL (CAAX protease family)
MGIQLKRENRSLRDFFLVAYLIPIIGVAFVTFKEGLQPALVTTQPSGLALVVLMAMIHSPTISAVIILLRDEGWEGVKALFRHLKNWSFNLKWYLRALLIFPAAMVTALLILSIFSKNYIAQFSFGILVLGAFISALWEEIGWIGYAIPRMLKRWRPLNTAILFGVIHMGWHLASDFWGSSAFYGTVSLYLSHVLLWLAGLIILRVMILWMYTRTQSLVLGWLTHVSWTGGQLLLTVHLSATETVIWNAVFIGILILVMAYLGLLNPDFRDFWKNNTYSE